MSIRILLVARTPSTRYTENGNSYGTTLFGDGARFDRGGGRQVRGPVTRWNLMATRRSDETFLSLQALSSSHFARRRRPFSTKCVWNQQAKARFGLDAHDGRHNSAALPGVKAWYILREGAQASSGRFLRGRPERSARGTLPSRFAFAAPGPHVRDVT